MKYFKNKRVPQYEYVSLYILDTQIYSGFLSPYNTRPLKCGEYNFNDIKFYINTGFCSNDLFSRFYDKLDFHKFDQVLNFINKIGGWRLLSIVPIVNPATTVTNNTLYKTNQFLYTWEREV